ncbi:MAG: transketolase [Calditrichaeota bacterium]|nr:MAG: transketolase [Calditrichota bacterium]
MKPIPNAVPGIQSQRLSANDLELLKKVANTIRGLAMDAVQKANSGHPGLPLGAAEMATVLWMRHLKHNPKDPSWPDRDRFVLSAGHGSMLLYALLYLTGYDLPLEQLKNFRQWGSKTPGHPEFGLTPGVETTTGPLGQGISNAVGMAIAERWLAQKFNRPPINLVDHYTYVLASDGDLMEGISHEAASLAGHLGLGKLIVFYDDNHISIDGPTDLTFTENVLQRFEAYGWEVQQVNGHDLQEVDAALNRAKLQRNRPSLIACRTVIGFGSPNRAGTAKAHGEPLGEEEIRLTKRNLNWPEEPEFYVPDEVLNFARDALETGALRQARWQEKCSRYEAAYPGAYKTFVQLLENTLPPGWDENLPTFSPENPIATRAASGVALNHLSQKIPQLVGGSADLSGSNKTRPDQERHLSAGDFSGRYLHFGVREHGMAAILNGMSLHGGIRPYGGTFLVFSDYMRPGIRLAALMGLPVIFVFTHDSIGLGEDGPTHQPIEHLASLRAIPNLVVLRPADATETVEAWRVALQRRDGPTALILTRQKLPVLPRGSGGLGPAQNVKYGAYILAPEPAGTPQVLLLASGSEVHLALQAREQLWTRSIAARVISMPSWELFAAQPASYRDSVLPPEIGARVAIEAGVELGWQKFIGPTGLVLGLNRFGASAPYQTLYQQFGLTAGRVVEAAMQVIEKNSNQ